MKKITLVLLAVLLVAAAVIIPVIAMNAGGVAASEAAGKPGEIVTVTFSLRGFPQVQAIGADFTVPEGLTLVEDEDQSKWLLDDPMLVDIDYASGMAAVGYAKAADFKEAKDILQFAFVIDEPAEGEALIEEIDFNVHFVIKDNKNEKTELDATAKISVSAPAEAVVLDKDALTLDFSGNQQDVLNATVKPAYTTDPVQWSSDDENVVTVDANGKVTAVGFGTANITVAAGKVSASCTVTVTCTHANAVETPAKDATCEEDGNDNYWYCADCVQYLKADKKTATTLEAETLAALGHKPTYYAAVKATCTENGNVAYWNCANCKNNYEDEACSKLIKSVLTEIDPNNHVGDTELRNVAEENCYTDGYTGDTFCLSCGNLSISGKVIPATGKHIADSAWLTDELYHWHDCTTDGCVAQVDKAEHAYQWKIDEAATEYATGLKHEECECGLKRSEGTVIPKLDHVHKDIQHHNAVAATCTQAGTVEYWTCGSDLCDGKFYGDADCQSLLDTIVEEINPNNHVGGTELKDAKAENCYQAGFTGNTCCVSCGTITVPGKEIPATGNHTAGTKWETDDGYHWHVCTIDGCGAVLDKTAHVFEWKTDKAATEYETGLKHEECFCGAKRNEGTVIDKLEHVHRDIKHHAPVAATCVQTGTVEYWTCGSDLCDGKFYGDAQCKTLLETIVEKINPNNHVGGTELKDAKAENCYQAGFTGNTCCVSCGTITVPGKEIPATGNHAAGTKWYADDANHWHVCTTEGCNAVVDKVAHTYQWKVDQAATEYAAGLKHEECFCGAKRNVDTVIPKLDHVHKDIKHYAAVAATCVQTGTVEYWTCGSDLCDGKFYGDANCQTLLNTVVAPVNPNNHAGGTTLKNQLDPTCGAEGYTGDTYCSDCDQLIKKGTVVAATGKHTAGKDFVSNGEQHWKVCTVCETKLDAAAHALKWIVDSEPSEEENGKKHQVCEICGYICSENTQIDKLEHAPVLIAGKANTCTEDGVAEHYFCDNCDRYYASVDGSIGEQIAAEDVVLKATGHTYATEWTVDATGHWHACHCGDVADKATHAGVVIGAVEATKTEAGYTGDTICSVCEYMIVKGKVVPSKQEAVLDNIQNADSGASVEIAVPNEDGSVDATIPVEVLESAKGKDVELVLNMGGYVWTIAGDKIFAAGQALDMTVNFELSNIPADVIATVAGNGAAQQLSFAHSGEFGFTAELEVALEKEFAGKTGNIYRYNANKELELVATEKIGDDGKVKVALDAAADYVIVVSDEGPADTSDTLLTVAIIAAVAVMAMVAEVVVISKRKQIC